jgi:hypothetical protein
MSVITHFRDKGSKTVHFFIELCSLDSKPTQVVVQTVENE